jgi:hypothetical protein
MVKPSPIEETFIVNFLKSLRVTIGAGTFSLVNREKNNAFMLKAGMTYDDMFDALRELSVNDYIEGPMPDDINQEHQVWVFGARHMGFDIYIKVKVFLIAGIDHGKAIAFHEAEYPLKYKYGR